MSPSGCGVGGQDPPQELWFCLCRSPDGTPPTPKLLCPPVGALPSLTPPTWLSIAPLQLCQRPSHCLSLSPSPAGTGLLRLLRGSSSPAGWRPVSPCAWGHAPCPPLGGGRVSPLSPRAAERHPPPQVKNVADGASVQDETATLAYSEKPTSPITAPPYSPPSYSYAPQNGYYPSGTYSSRG